MWNSPIILKKIIIHNKDYNINNNYYNDIMSYFRYMYVGEHYENLVFPFKRDNNQII